VLRAGNNIVADVFAQCPKRFIGLATISPHDGMHGAREPMHLVKKHRFGALLVPSLYNTVPANDRQCYPLYAKCVELDIPVRTYTNINYASDRPYYLGHPRHLDKIAMDLPEFRIVAGPSGWPWVNEILALVRRHPDLYCDTASHRPRYFGVAGSGWEQLLQFGNTLLQDKVMVGLS
jgi:predicted TIM-barrel fold metal-dependent hydrolase